MKPIQIVGGGLAGLTLGIALRRKGVPVTLHEAAGYPRHRVCGEFICGRGLAVLERLGLKHEFELAGATTAKSARFFTEIAGSPARSLAIPALCLSRFKMDALLAEHFSSLGGSLVTNARWRGDYGAGIVRATGRRLTPQQNGWRWFGLKVHARGVHLTADLEMHCLENGYVGICRLAGGNANVCGLFRRAAPAEKNDPPASHELLRGREGSPLWQRLHSAEFEQDSACAVAGLPLAKPELAELGECSIGDSLAMIPPVTGNGMSIAFESASLALEPIVRFSQGELAWPEAAALVSRACREMFARRLIWAHRLQQLMFSPLLRTRLASVLLGSGILWRVMFSRTR